MPLHLLLGNDVRTTQAASRGCWRKPFTGRAKNLDVSPLGSAERPYESIVNGP